MEENKIQLIIKHFSDGVLVFDEESRLTLINPQAEEFLGIKEKEVIGKPFQELLNVQNLKPLMNFLDYKTVWGIFKKEIFTEEKKGLTLEIITIPLKEGDKNFGTVVVLRDITREKNIEKMKNDFVSLAAHQLRTPLSALKWIMAVILEGRAGQLNEEQKNLLDKGYQSNERMIKLINDLLNITRLEEGKYIFNPSLVDLQEITQEAINSLEEEIKNKNLNVDFEKPTGEVFSKVKADTEQIKVVVRNLIDNAIKYTPEGGKIKISLEDKKTEVEFKIQDSGIGIPEDQKDKIFSKFFRASSAIQMETDGSGLGLYLIKNIIEAHKGKIDFVSKEGKGSTFWFTLPIKEEFEEILERF